MWNQFVFIGSNVEMNNCIVFLECSFILDCFLFFIVVCELLSAPPSGFPLRNNDPNELASILLMSLKDSTMKTWHVAHLWAFMASCEVNCANFMY